MSTLPKSRIRIAGDLFRFKRLTDQLRPSQINQFEEETPLVPRFHGADSLQIEVAIFNDGVLLTDLSAITELELVIKPLRAADPASINIDDPNPDQVRGPASNVAPIVCKRLGSEHFNAALSDSQWQSKAASMAHAIITLDSEEAALAPGERWLSLIALGHDGQARTLAAGAVLILGGGPTFNALPQPVVKDLRDQAAQSAAQALHSANNAAASAQAAQNYVFAAQEQVTLATQQADAAGTAATQAGNAEAHAQQAASESAQARNASQQFAQDAEASARQAQQTATKLGNLDAALEQAATEANRSQREANRAEAASLAASTYAAVLNPAAKATASGIYLDGINGFIQALRPSLSGGQLCVFFRYRRLTPASVPANTSIIGVTRVSTLANGGWDILYDGDAANVTPVLRIGSTHMANLTWAGAASAQAIGEWACWAFNIDNTAADVIDAEFFFNGASAGSRQSTGSAPYQDSGDDPLYIGRQSVRAERLEMEIANVVIFNRTLSAGEHADLAASAGAIVPVSTRTALPAGEVAYASNFSTNSDGWSTTATTGIDFLAGATVGGQSDAWHWVSNGTGTSTTLFSQRNILPNNNPLWDGRYALQMQVYVPGTNTVIAGFSLGHPTGDLHPSAAFDNLPKDQWITVRAVYNGLGTGSAHNSFLYARDSNGSLIPATSAPAGEQIAFKDITVTRLGCVLNLPMDDGAGYQLRDASGNGSHALLSQSGCTHLITGRQFEFSWTRTSSGFLGDTDRPVLPDGAVIESVIWEDAKTTRTTASLGFGESTAQRATHVASFTPAQARQSATLATGSMAVAERRLYLHMSANAGTVTVRISGRIL